MGRYGGRSGGGVGEDNRYHRHEAVVDAIIAAVCRAAVALKDTLHVEEEHSVAESTSGAKVKAFISGCLGDPSSLNY